MNEQQKAMLDRQLKLQRGAAIIEGTQEKFRQDGYSNLLNKYGTAQDSSTSYQYNQEIITNDMELIRLYEGNGLFTKIIDRPSEEAVKHGFDIDFGDDSIAEYVDDRMDDLDFESKFATAEKWARLYGGSIIVMLVDDGRGLEEPLDWANVRSIEELRVFERAIVQPDYTSMYHFHFLDTLDSDRPFAEPEYYQVFSIYGYFIVHRSRCLVFRNGRLPEQTTNAIYRYWGIPEYVKIKRALRECITSHENGTKLLERCVQAIYKMKNLANLLSTEDGEDKVLQRLQVIDMARSILNSIAIDSDGEDYDFKTFSMSGVKDVLDSTCNMLSAVTEIPQTILFGRSPAGMNSTGENDMENYYNMVENIQKQNMKKNSRTVLDLILIQGKREGRITKIPKYKTKFAALWSMSDAEKANVDKTKAETEQVKAQTAQVYMDSNVLDPSEVRKSLASKGDFEIEEVLSEEELNLPENTFDVGEMATVGEPIEILGQTADENEEGTIEIDMPGSQLRTGEKVVIKDTEGDAGHGAETIIVKGIFEKGDGADYPAAAVIIIKDGKILCASRRNNEGVCGPGGHVEEGEEPEDTAVREAMEEFNIVPLNLQPLGEYKGGIGSYLPSMVYWTDTFSGTPEADGDELLDARWLSLGEIYNEQLFPPFEASLEKLENLLKNYLQTSNPTDTIIIQNLDGGEGSGNWGHEGRPGKIGGSAKGGGKANRTGTKESGFSSEAKKRAAEKKSAKGSNGTGKSAGSSAGKKSSGESKGKSSNSKVPKVESKSFKEMTRMNNHAPDDVYYEVALKPQGIKKYSKEYDSAMRQFHTKKWQKENGSNEEWAEQNFDKFVEAQKKTLEDKMDCFRNGDAAKEYEKKVIGRMDKDYGKTVSAYSDYDNDIKPKEFYELQKKSMEGMTTEDFAIMENSYYHSAEAYENSYVAYTSAKLGGQELNWAQKRMEQIVDEHSVEIPEGRTFFRKTSEEEFYALTGKRLSEFDNNAPASERTATIEKCTSFGAALQYDSFANSNVMIEYVTKTGAKAFFSTNTDEMEGILPPGTRITNITVKGSSNEQVPTIFRNTTAGTKTGKEGALYYDPKAKVDYTLGSGNMDFTYSGKGVHNEWIKSRQSQQNYNPNYNNLTRVVVEVEG